jgi:hypothetical protein
MNILYESLKEKGTMVIVPSTAIDSMGLGGTMGLSAFARQHADGLQVGPTLGQPPAPPKGAEAEAEEDLFGSEESGDENSDGKE